MKIQFGSMLQFKFTAEAVDKEHAGLASQVKRRSKTSTGKLRKPSLKQNTIKQKLTKTRYRQDPEGEIIQTFRNVAGALLRKYSGVEFVGLMLGNSVSSSFIQVSTGSGRKPFDMEVAGFLSDRKFQHQSRTSKFHEPAGELITLEEGGREVGIVVKHDRVDGSKYVMSNTGRTRGLYIYKDFYRVPDAEIKMEMTARSLREDADLEEQAARLGGVERLASLGKYHGEYIRKKAAGLPKKDAS